VARRIDPAHDSAALLRPELAERAAQPARGCGVAAARQRRAHRIRSLPVWRRAAVVGDLIQYPIVAIMILAPGLRWCSRSALAWWITHRLILRTPTR